MCWNSALHPIKNIIHVTEKKVNTIVSFIFFLFTWKLILTIKFWQLQTCTLLICFFFGYLFARCFLFFSFFFFFLEKDHKTEYCQQQSMQEQSLSWRDKVHFQCQLSPCIRFGAWYLCKVSVQEYEETTGFMLTLKSCTKWVLRNLAKKYLKCQYKHFVANRWRSMNTVPKENYSTFWNDEKISFENLNFFFVHVWLPQRFADQQHEWLRIIFDPPN